MTANQNAIKPAFRYLAKTTNYKEAYSYINRYSYFLQNEIMHNKKVLVFMSNCPHLAYTFFALANTKNISYVVDPNTPEPKIIDKIKELGIEAIIVSDDYLGKVQQMCKNNSIMIPIIQCESRRWGEYDTTYRLPPSMSAAETDVVTYFETTGTTGKPKMVPYTHNMILQACLFMRSAYRLAPIDNFFTMGASLAQPFYFIHGLMFPLIHGAAITITDITSPEDLMKELLEAKATRLLMRGAAVEEWLNGIKNANLKFPTLRSITPEVWPIHPRVQDLLNSDFNEAKILHVYGSVETCWALAMRSFEEPEAFDSVGKLLPGVKTRIVDENGDDIPGNKRQMGQLLVSGPSVTTTYLNNKEANKLNIRGQWLFTGDIVEKDKNETLHFLDRKDNLCKVVTDTVVPVFVEKKLEEIPGVERAAVTHIKDQMGKPQLTAFIIKKQGMEISTIELADRCKEKIANERERPKSFAFMNEFPLDAHGQINKYKIRYEFNS